MLHTRNLYEYAARNERSKMALKILHYFIKSLNTAFFKICPNKADTPC